MTSRTVSQLRESPEIAIFAVMTTQTNGRPLPVAPAPAHAPDKAPGEAATTEPTRPREIGGPNGPEPTRYGDWEFNGRCTDF